MEHTSHDTLSLARRIGEAGMEQTQADAIAWAIRDTFKEASAELATKADMVKLDGRIDKVEARIDKVDAKVDRLESRVDGLEIKIDGLDASLRAELTWLPLRVCWWMLLTFSTAAGLVLAAQQLWSSGLLQTWFG